MANTVYKNAQVCLGTYLNVPLDFNYLSVNWWVEVLTDPFPPQMNATLDIIHNYSAVSINTIPAGGIGARTLTIEVRDGDGGTVLATYDIVIDVVAVCIEEIEACCDEAVYLRWLSPTGGIREWPFPGIREFEIRVGDALTFKNSNLQIQYSERKNIYSGKRVTSGNITRNVYDYLTSLKVAIQAWEYNPSTEVLTPILVDNESFPTYTSKQKFYEFAVNYIIAAESIIQTQ